MSDRFRAALCVIAASSAFLVLSGCSSKASPTMPETMETPTHWTHAEWRKWCAEIEAFSLGAPLPPSAPEGPHRMRLRGWIEASGMVQRLTAALSAAEPEEGKLSADPCPSLVLRSGRQLGFVRLARVTHDRPGYVLFDDAYAPLTDDLRRVLSEAYGLPSYSVNDAW